MLKETFLFFFPRTPLINNFKIINEWRVGLERMCPSRQQNNNNNNKQHISSKEANIPKRKVHVFSTFKWAKFFQLLIQSLILQTLGSKVCKGRYTKGKSMFSLRLVRSAMYGATFKLVTTVIFVTLKDGSLQIDILVSNNCFSYRNVYQNGVKALSKMVNYFLCQKAQKFV